MIIDNTDGASLEGTICENEDLIVIAKRGATVNLANSRIGKSLLIICKNKYSFTVGIAVSLDVDALRPHSDSDETYVKEFGCHIRIDVRNAHIGFNK